jgi:hypothetical protein
MAGSPELICYQPVLQDSQNTSGTDKTNANDPTVEELRMLPLVWWKTVHKTMHPSLMAQREPQFS